MERYLLLCTTSSKTVSVLTDFHNALTTYMFFFSKIHNIGIISCTNNPIKLCTFCIVPDRRGCTRQCKYAQVKNTFQIALINWNIFYNNTLLSFLPFILFSLSLSLSIYLKGLILFIFRILINVIPKVAYKCSNFINI